MHVHMTALPQYDRSKLRGTRVEERVSAVEFVMYRANERRGLVADGAIHHQQAAR